MQFSSIIHTHTVYMYMYMHIHVSPAYSHVQCTCTCIVASIRILCSVPLHDHFRGATVSIFALFHSMHVHTFYVHAIVTGRRDRIAITDTSHCRVEEVSFREVHVHVGEHGEAQQHPTQAR